MNNEQQNTYKKAYVTAQADYLDRLAQHCDYALTLQTHSNIATTQRYIDLRPAVIKAAVELI
jgi:hypothetical protein